MDAERVAFLEHEAELLKWAAEMKELKGMLDSEGDPKLVAELERDYEVLFFQRPQRYED